MTGVARGTVRWGSRLVVVAGLVIMIVTGFRAGASEYLLDNPSECRTTTPGELVDCDVPAVTAALHALRWPMGLGAAVVVVGLLACLARRHGGRRPVLAVSEVVVAGAVGAATTFLSLYELAVLHGGLISVAAAAGSVVVLALVLDRVLGAGDRGGGSRARLALALGAAAAGVTAATDVLHWSRGLDPTGVAPTVLLAVGAPAAEWAVVVLAVLVGSRRPAPAGRATPAPSPVVLPG